MNITKEWLETLASIHGVKPKIVRDALWPDTPNRSLAYFNSYKNIRVKYLEIIADTLKCSVDEILRRPYPSSAGQTISGDNNHVGNVNINNDVESLKKIIDAQSQIITHQDAEIKRMEQLTREQLSAKDQQISELGTRIDRLIDLAKQNGNQ